MKVSWRLMGARSISDRDDWKLGAGAFALALLCVLFIALLQRGGWLDELNIGSMTMAGDVRQTDVGRWATPVMLIASIIGNTAGRLIIVCVAMIALAVAGHVRRGCWIAIVAVSGTVLNTCLKQVFSAPRPDLLPHLDIVHSYSFPSGHAAGSMILFGALALASGRAFAYFLAAMAIALIGVSRVWLGVHWPSDVLAGWTVGLGWLALCRHWLPAGRGE